MEPTIAASIGHQSEKLRYNFEDAASARRHVLEDLMNTSKVDAARIVANQIYRHFNDVDHEYLSEG